MYNPHKEESISLLSSEAPSPNYRGFLNLGMILIIVVNCRLIVENAVNYGIWVGDSLFNGWGNWPIYVTYLSLSVPFFTSYFIEMSLGTVLPQALISILQLSLLLGTVAIPPMVISYTNAHFLLGSLLLMFTCIVTMKMYSFSDVMKDVRESYISKEYENFPSSFREIIEKYPNVTTLSHYSMYWFYPTLCFQFTYPRTNSIRKVWLLKRIVEWAIINLLMLTIVSQYMMPIVRNTIPILQEENLNYLVLLERHLKLAVPNLYIWLLMFASLFHCWCNIFGELTRFSDRTFYKEWWNAHTMSEYWKLWNIPVHSFMFRHVYVPLITRGLRKEGALLVVFTISALGHEYIASGACQILTYWSFIAIEAQIPMILTMDLFRKQLQQTQIGNVIFWVSFCIIGQPLAILIYSYQQVIRAV